MLTRSIYSAISYAVVVAALSGYAAAAPAEVNGVEPLTSAKLPQAYLALNHRLDSIPTYTVTAPSLAKPAVSTPVSASYSSSTLDPLEKRMQRRLDALIELSGF